MHLIRPDWPALASTVAFTTTRLGGVSTPPYAELNLGTHVNDVPAHVAENRRRLGAQLPQGSTIQWLDQVHGTHVATAGSGPQPPPADACFSDDPGQVCAVLTADCLPLLLTDQAGTAVAAVHAGWRGLCAGVVEATIARFSRPDHVLAWMGPAIGPAAFEVGEEVRSSFLAAGGSARATDSCFVPLRSRPGYFLADLYALARLRLEAAGVSQVYGGELCTVSDPRHFFSYRRDGQTGRMATVITLPTR